MTKRQMYIKLVVSSLIRRKARMIVALLAVAIGATIMSGLVTIYYDIPRQLGKEFRFMVQTLLCYQQEMKK